MDRFAAEFAGLLAEEGLDDLDGFFGEIETFDEVPLYSRYSQVEFLSGLPTGERNVLLLRCGVEYLEKLVECAEERPEDLVCLLSVTGWDDFREGDLLLPSIWYTRRHKGIVDRLGLAEAKGQEAQFVTAAVADSNAVRVLESHPPVTRNPAYERLYVAVPPFPAGIG